MSGNGHKSGKQVEYAWANMLTEEDKKEPDGPCEMGLTDPYPWANKGQAQLT